MLLSLLLLLLLLPLLILYYYYIVIIIIIIIIITVWLLIFASADSPKLSKYSIYRMKCAMLYRCVDLNRRFFVYIFCLISIRGLVSYWEIQWSAVNNDRVLKDKFCQKIWVQYIKCILRNACLKTRIITANVWLINYFATQLFGVFLKTNIFSKTERKKLKFFLISKFEKLFYF